MTHPNSDELLPPRHIEQPLPGAVDQIAHFKALGRIVRLPDLIGSEAATQFADQERAIREETVRVRAELMHHRAAQPVLWR